MDYVKVGFLVYRKPPVLTYFVKVKCLSPFCLEPSVLNRRLPANRTDRAKSFD